MVSVAKLLLDKIKVTKEGFIMKWSKTSFQKLSVLIDNLTKNEITFYKRHFADTRNVKYKEIGSSVLRYGANRKLVLYMEKMKELLSLKDLEHEDVGFKVNTTVKHIEDDMLKEINKVFEDVELVFETTNRAGYQGTTLISDKGLPSDFTKKLIALTFTNDAQEVDNVREMLLPYVKESNHKVLKMYQAIFNNSIPIFKIRILIEKEGKVYFEATFTKYKDKLNFYTLHNEVEFRELKDTYSQLAVSFNEINDAETSIPTLGKELKKMLREQSSDNYQELNNVIAIQAEQYILRTF